MFFLRYWRYKHIKLAARLCSWALRASSMSRTGLMNKNSDLDAYQTGFWSYPNILDKPENAIQGPNLRPVCWKKVSDELLS